MCTIVILKNYLQSYPLAIAANRDELLDRPSEPPQLREETILAPKDLQRGGSWIGVNNAGMFVGLTNRRAVISEPGRISRGDLVMNILRHTSVENALQNYVSRLDGSKFNGFNLAMVDQNHAYLVMGSGQKLDILPMEDGLWAITNHGVGRKNATNNWQYELVQLPGEPEYPQRINAVTSDLETTRLKFHLDLNKYIAAMPNALTRSTLARDLLVMGLVFLEMHDDWQFGTCIHMPEENYGSKSSSLICLDRTSNQWHYWHRERPSSEQHLCSADYDWKLTLSLK